MNRCETYGEKIIGLLNKYRDKEDNRYLCLPPYKDLCALGYWEQMDADGNVRWCWEETNKVE